MEWYIFLFVVAIGFVSGFINTLAGSGSLVSILMLIHLGLPINVANGTNRIAIMMQNIVGVASFKKQKVFEWKEGIYLSIPTAVGATIGALSAISLKNDIMEIVIAIILLFMLGILVIKPDKWIKGQAGKFKEKPSVWQIIIFFFIGLYGGFIQAGVGFFLLAGLVLSAGFNLVKANAVKVFIVLMYIPLTLAIFAFSGQVNYLFGIVLGIGNMAGAFLATKVAVKWGPQFIRYFLIVIIFGSALKLLYDNIFPPILEL